MFGMGWAEMMIVGVVALIVVGPKDLPIMFRKLGNAVGKARGMAREFTRAMNDAADSSGMKGTMDSINSVAKTVKEPTKAWTNYTPGSETEKLAKERAEKSDSLKEDAAARAKAKEDAEAVNRIAGVASADEANPDPKPTPKKPAAKKPAAKKTPAKKPKAAPKAKKSAE